MDKNHGAALLWSLSLIVYPLTMLLLGGFLGFGMVTIIIVLASLLVSSMGRIKAIVGLIAVVYLGISVFVNYFEHRDNIRREVWGGGSLASKIGATLEIVHGFKWFDPDDRRQLTALNERLNQNYFAGLANARIEDGAVDYLYGRSVWEGFISVIPRALWPEKPVYGGSPGIISEMTGLIVNEQTSFGVGNVMEFQINFGIPGLIGGFFILGALIRMLDRRAAVAERQGNFGTAIMCFLPAVALIQPGNSMVELCGGSAAAWVGAKGWKWVWEYWSTGRTGGSRRSQVSSHGRDVHPRNESFGRRD